MSAINGRPPRRSKPLRGCVAVLASGAIGVLCGVLAGRALAVYLLSRDPELWADYLAGRHISEDEMGMVGLPMIFGLLGGLIGTAIGAFGPRGNKNLP